jgi:hypothetical protein
MVDLTEEKKHYDSEKGILPIKSYPIKQLAVFSSG